MWIEPPELANDIAYSRFLTLFVEGKFLSFFIFIWNRILSLYFTRTGRRKAYALFSRRLLILLFMGLVHFYFQPGEALTVYAIFGFVALPFIKCAKTSISSLDSSY